MGTSKSFSDLNSKGPELPNWPTLSNSITRACDGGILPQPRIKRILSNYVSTVGGASVTGRGGSKAVGRAGIATAKKLGAVFSAFQGGADIKSALAEVGLTNLEGKTVQDVINHLIEFCSGPTSSIDENAAKEASRMLLENLVSDAETIEDLESVLEERFDIDSSEDLIIQYFGYYVYEHLSKWFYEHLVRKKNETDCKSLFRQIKDCINQMLITVNRTNPLHNIDWGSTDADRIIKNIYQDVLTVFE